LFCVNSPAARRPPRYPRACPALEGDPGPPRLGPMAAPPRTTGLGLGVQRMPACAGRSLQGVVLQPDCLYGPCWAPPRRHASRRPVSHPPARSMAYRALLRPALARPLTTTQLLRPFGTVVDAPVAAAAQQPPPSNVFESALQATGPRTSWTKAEITEIYNKPLIDLTYAAVSALRAPLLRPPEKAHMANHLPSLPSTGASTTPPPSRCAR